jgi:hypothetical protein
MHEITGRYTNSEEMCVLQHKQKSRLVSSQPPISRQDSENHQDSQDRDSKHQIDPTNPGDSGRLDGMRLGT